MSHLAERLFPDAIHGLTADMRHKGGPFSPMVVTRSAAADMAVMGNEPVRPTMGQNAPDYDIA